METDLLALKKKLIRLRKRKEKLFEELKKNNYKMKPEYVCQYCNQPKENVYGICPNCHRFPRFKYSEQIFDKWYTDNEKTFHCGQFDVKQIAYAAFLYGAEMKHYMMGEHNIEDFYKED